MRIGIIGAGPSGSQCAAVLSKAGADVILLDPHGAWEKPCGGGVTHKALIRYPFLWESVDKGREIRNLEIVSPQDRSLAVALDFPLVTYSRDILNRLLLDRAVAQGAQFLQERVIAFTAVGAGWEIKTDRSYYEVNFLVGADGVNSLVRKRLGQPYSKGDLMMTFGYRQQRQGGSTIELKFYPGFPGYLWVFPRPENVSFGICGKLDRVRTETLKAKLHDYMRKTNRSSVPGSKEPGRAMPCELYGALVPSLRPETLRKNVISGKGWALLGDAAGFADPITAEGIYYALRSGQLLAEALKTQDADSYAEACREDFVSDFISGAEFFDQFYAGNLLGSSFINRMIQIARHSTTLRKVVNAFVAGQQPYRTLQTALLGKAPRVAGDMLLSVIASSIS